MPDIRCNICGGEVGFFNHEIPLHGQRRFYCLDPMCENHGGLQKKSAFDTQVGGDWYKTLAIQPLEYCHKNNLNMAESGIVKYVTRHKAKDGKKDLLKARHLIDMLIEMEYPDGNNSL
jgi:hypothetical protein